MTTSTPHQDSQALISQFPVHASVRFKESALLGYVEQTAAKLRNRIGVVKGHQPLTGWPIVVFPSPGQRKPLELSVQNASERLVVVTDDCDLADLTAAMTAGALRKT